MTPLPRFAFFGTPDFSVRILNVLEQHGLLPVLVVTAPDRPRGRGQKYQATPVKIWGEKRNILVLTPSSLRQDPEHFVRELQGFDLDYNVVAAYGLIIPDNILSVPRLGSINVHPSLLPLYRGASPIESQIMNDEKNFGVTIMMMDEEMDHGPILSQLELKRPNAMPNALELEKTLSDVGARLLAETMIDHFEGRVEPVAQDHDRATYTRKITKDDGLIDLEGDPYKNFLSIQAHMRFKPHFFLHSGNKKIRVVIKKASYDEKNHKLLIERVVPEGGKEIDFSDLS